ncbi:hypothetical protein IP81_01295 [Novosphingobium sp. AAP83]|uniref:SPOR domain-containing protein n=1 Tax=Novosphingobium sp. AAP83 TaxID=1523425 RepID=UPI0006B9A7F9|nr:SPOR domain-containing protein [Novosphingobium sp. AAP83]KPF93807.1 hypothetical protein IP81_01295 [Novosphingobium sp. AAP83]
MSGDEQKSWADQGIGLGKPFDVSAELGAAEETVERLALGEEDRLPWLESADDVDADEEESGTGRLIGFAVMGLIALAALIGGIWYATNKTAGPSDADGSLIEASKEPYKVAPSDPGGKTFEGTGDSSFKVSEGEKPNANLAGSGVPAPMVTPSAKPSAGAGTGSTAGVATSGSAVPAASANKPAVPVSGGVGVQIGAFSSNAAAEAAWSKLSGNNAALQGLQHRVVEGKADIGTVYRLQAVSGDVSAANALCQRLQAGGLKCQVKR